MQPQEFLAKIFGGFDKKGPPTKPPPVTAPDPEDLTAKRQAQREARRRYGSGRTSTVLSGSSTLG